MAILHVKTPNGITKAYDLDKMGGIPVGFEYFSMNPNVPQGSLPLLGGEYNRATYPDLWTWVQSQTGYCKTESEWQTLSAANNGNVPFYSSGDGSTTFRVPSLKCWVKGANGTVSEVGSYLEAGLPNITGDFTLSPRWLYHSPSHTSGSRQLISDAQTGAFYQVWKDQWGSDIIAEEASNVFDWPNIGFDASLSNSIYGNANTVVPESIVGMWLVKAYGTVEETGTINEQQYIDDRLAAEITRADGKYESVVASGTNYIRYENGLQIIIGYSGAKLAGNLETFPVPFKDTSYRVATSTFDQSINAWASNHTTTSITTHTNASGGASMNWMCIGWWK